MTTEDGKKTDIITFIVYEKPVEYVDVESITVTPESLELTAGDEFLLTAVVLPDNATDRSKITWLKCQVVCISGLAGHTICHNYLTLPL